MKRRKCWDNMKIEVDEAKRELILEAKDLPMTVVYGDKRYVLILTKNDRLIMNKYEE
jgi:hypothetical protein